jgi:hypothetical protein
MKKTRKQFNPITINVALDGKGACGKLPSYVRKTYPKRILKEYLSGLNSAEKFIYWNSK